ncbi:unnamed protein product [Miscanthus lutarioriparius]|uniref:Xylanase inhibitor N-terminal domain-containing protein n=1 Tax=Miscanthus lutarioriparius TaxID=422564 RepID=A0A811SSQ9_9POAL|nr:unnamed protein product [Miscanthus lutarioriparius]
MWNPKLLIFISLCISALSSPCTAASGAGKPLVTGVTKDASTSHYTAPLKDGHPLVLDLTSPVISLTTCAFKNGTLATLSANATDGQNPLFPVSFSAVATCTPSSPLKLPAGAVGVTGIAPSTQSFPAQVARTQKVANKIALCLPSDGKSTSGNSVGVAIFCGGPFVFPDRGDFTTMLAGRHGAAEWVQRSLRVLCLLHRHRRGAESRRHLRRATRRGAVRAVLRLDEAAADAMLQGGQN